MLNSHGSEDKLEGKAATRLSVLHDLYVDLLGSLVPGLLTVILGGMAIFLAVSTVHVALFQRPIISSAFPGGVIGVVPAMHWEFATVTIVSAYVIGSVFFRQDPKRPDAASALHVWMHSKKGDRSGLAVQATKQLPRSLELVEQNGMPTLGERLLSQLQTPSYIEKLGLDAQFPYMHLRCYLAARGLEHLIHLVPWCPQKPDTVAFRTKMYINILKVRVLSRYPHMSRDIIRNEAHVRLATSVWYACTSLLYLAVLVLLVLLVAGVFCVGLDMKSPLFVSTAVCLLLGFFCVAMRYHLRKCIHYMRVREVIYVLESAHGAEQIGGEGLFADLIKKDNSSACVKCERMNR